MSIDQNYCHNTTQYSRWKTREVKVGEVVIGGNNPIVVQSMTTTDTMDTSATVAQSIRMIEAGCELVRITAPSKKEAKNLGLIKSELKKAGFNTPLVADIHFTPNAAEIAAQLIEKVRVNPGNYADKKRFQQLDFSDSSYQEELDRIYDRFSPLVKICKEYGTAMRIGTNHGSLSDRIMSRYGDTPLGMVESAMEFIRICEDHNYHNLVISMKSSNPKVMVQAYRLLVNQMMQNEMNYPLHLGVTEAGEAEDGRIKSAVGIGTLLEDGLGDTVRVSLTEEPEHEIPVAKALVKRYHKRKQEPAFAEKLTEIIHPFEYQKRKTNSVLNIGGSNHPIVISDLRNRNKITPATLFPLGYQYSVPLDKWNINDTACDYILVDHTPVNFKTPGSLGIVLPANQWMTVSEKPRHYPLWKLKDFHNDSNHSNDLNFVELSLTDSFEMLLKIDSLKKVVFVLNANSNHQMAEQRHLVSLLMKHGIDHPVVGFQKYFQKSNDEFMLYSATDFGGLLVDGLIDGMILSAAEISQQLINETAFGILQATRTRISKTEYISCPSCGRTLFDLQETTAKIRAKTNHLKGVKIGIMGCIVNGPGEMADADYGYVGTGPGKITLYKEKEVVKRNVAEKDALNELIDLIKEHGDWVDI